MTDHGASTPAEAPAAPRKKGKLLFIAVPVLLCLAGAGAWFSGLRPAIP